MPEQDLETQLENQNTDQQNTETLPIEPEPEVKNEPVKPVVAPLDLRQREAMIETMRENVKLREQMEAMRQPPPAPEDAKDFFDNPHKATREIIQREIKQQIDPLVKFAQKFQAKDTLSEMKAQYANNPIFAKIGPVVDQMLMGKEVTEDVYRATFYAATGMYYNNDLAQYGIPFEPPTNPTPATRTPTTPEPLRRPAIMSPTPPGVPKAPGSEGRRPLTESERVNMIRFGLSEDEAYAALGIGDEQGSGDIDTLRQRFPTKKKETK